MRLLKDRTFIVPTRKQSLRNDANRLLNDAHITPKKLIEVGNIETQLQMVAEGLGVSFVRESYAAWFQYVKRPRLFSVGTPIASKPLFVIYRKEMRNRPGFSCLVQIIREVVEQGISQHLK